MEEKMPLEKCKACKNHISYQQGYVMCDYHKFQEQRITEKKEKDIIYVVIVP